MTLNHKRSHVAFLSFIKWFLSSKSEYVFQKEPWQKKLFANFICESSFIEEFEENKLIEFQDIKMLEFKKEDYKNKDSNYLEPILRLAKYANENLKEFLLDFIIHGSISTLDYSIGWSDLDTLLIIKKEILKSPKKMIDLRGHLMKILPELYIIDPLQHHQFIITTEKAMLKKTVKISKSRNNKNAEKSLLAVNNLFKKSFEGGYMNHHKKENIALEDNFRNKYCMYQLKYFLSCVMILPTYYLDSKGNSCYKKYSFEKFYSMLNIDSEILDKATKIREIWPEREKFPYKGNKIPNWICELLGNDY